MHTDSDLRFDRYILKNLVVPYASYVRKLANCHEMYCLLIGRRNELAIEQQLFLVPGINILSEALKLIEFICNVKKITAEVYPFIQQIEMQLCRDVSNIQFKIEELQESHRG